MRTGCTVSSRIPIRLRLGKETYINDRFYALSYSETVAPLPPRTILMAGSQWAKIAQRLILETIDIVTIENLMV